MDPLTLTSKARVNQSIRFGRPDRPPRDFAAVPEVWSALESHFGVSTRADVLERLGIDCRVVSYDSYCDDPNATAGGVDLEASLERSSTGGMWRRREPDGSNRDIWGAHRRRVANEHGGHEEFASFPLRGVRNIDELRRYRWPSPDWWTFATLRDDIAALDRSKSYNIRYRIGSVFETAWSLCGFEDFLCDLAADPAVPRYVMERITEVHAANLDRVLQTAGDLIDIVYFYDDLASQTGLLMRPETFDEHIRPFHQRLIEIAVHHDKPVMFHCCGAVRPLIPRLIDMGIRILNPVQPRARGMAIDELAREFGGRIVFHGGIDIQELLPRGTPAEIRAEVLRVTGLFDQWGGYILSGAHHIQADTPVANILAMYDVE